MSDTPFRVREDGRGWVDGPVKIVGRPKPHDPVLALHWNAEMMKLSPRCRHPVIRGVFKFKTWEEEREWTRLQINQATTRQS